MRDILDILSEMAELGAKVEFSDSGLGKLERIIEKENAEQISKEERSSQHND